MAEIKDAFVCYRSYIEAIRLLPEDKRWGFFQKLFSYALDGAPPEFNDGMETAMFMLMKANLDSCNKRYSACVENGKKGGNPNFQKGTPNPYKNKLCKLSNNPKDNVNANDTLLSASEGWGLTAPPPPQDQFQMGGEMYEYYIAEDGERRVRKIERPPQ